MSAIDPQPGAPAECRVSLQPLREDVVGADALQAPPASFAPQVVDGFFVVPSVATPSRERQ